MPGDLSGAAAGPATGVAAAGALGFAASDVGADIAPVGAGADALMALGRPATSGSVASPEPSLLALGEATVSLAADLASIFPKTTSAEPNHRIYFLEEAESGQTAGYVFWAERRPPGSQETRAYLYELFVDEAFRRQGLGLRALELVEADVRDRGLPGIDLNVWGGNAAARSLYRQAGFSERAVFMTKELA